jgi:enoyl-CoA hydratase
MMHVVTEERGIREERDGPIATLTLDTPQTRNALTDPLLADLRACLAALDADPDVRCVVLAGSAKVFASGADVRALLARTVDAAYRGDRVAHWAAIRRTATPMVAAVRGFCLGGGLELALMCDVVVAGSSARFGAPETQLGLIPGAGATQLLPRLVGKAVAADMVLAGRILDADEAARLGLVSRVVPDDALQSTAGEVAGRIAERPAVAQRLAKEALSAAFETPLGAGLEVERKAFALAFGSGDAREGMTAFVDKREPNWSHR